MQLREISETALAERLAGAGVGIDFGAARARIRSDVEALPGLLKNLYGSFEALDPEGFFDATGSLRHARGVRRFLNPHEYPVGLEQGLHAERMRLVVEAKGLEGANDIVP